MLLLALVGGECVNAQRPVWDTIPVGDGDYLFQPLHLDGSYCSTQMPSSSGGFDYIYWNYNHDLVWSMMSNGQMTWMEFLHTYPDLASLSLGRHITGQEYTADEDMMVIGLAVCPTILTDMGQNFTSFFYEWQYEDSLGRGDTPIYSFSKATGNW